MLNDNMKANCSKHKDVVSTLYWAVVSHAGSRPTISTYLHWSAINKRDAHNAN